MECDCKLKSFIARQMQLKQILDEVCGGFQGRNFQINTVIVEFLKKIDNINSHSKRRGVLFNESILLKSLNWLFRFSRIFF
jgi:hypothetical protein